MKNAVKLIVALLILAVVIVLLLLFGNKYSEQVQFAKDNPTVEYFKPESKNERPDDVVIAQKIKDALLKTYGVSEFAEILYLNKDELLGNLIDIVPTNPGASDGEFSLKFTPEPRIGTWSRQQGVNAATEAMRAAGSQIPEVNGITADIETYDYNNNKTGALVSSDRVGREVLGESDGS